MESSPRQRWGSKFGGVKSEAAMSPCRLRRPLSNRRYVPRAVTTAPGRSQVRAGVRDPAADARKPSQRTVETPTSTVAVVWAAEARTPNTDVAAARDAVQTCRAAGAGRTGLGAAGALLAGPRVHEHVRGRRRGRGGGRGGCAQSDVTLDGATELDQVRVSGPRGEAEYGSGRAVDGDSARHEIGKHGERYGKGLSPSVPQLGQGRLGRPGAEHRAGLAVVFIAGHGRRGVGQPTRPVHEEGVVITAGYERHHRRPKRLASGPSHRRTRRIPVVEVADELHVRGAGSDQDELKGARLALRGSGRGGGHPVEEDADRKGGSRYEAAERCEGELVRAPEPAPQLPPERGAAGRWERGDLAHDPSIERRVDLDGSSQMPRDPFDRVVRRVKHVPPLSASPGAAPAPASRASLARRRPRR